MRLLSFEDDDKGSCINALEEIKKLILMMIFILLMVEIEIKKIYQKCLFHGMNFLFSVGGDDKKNSSSWILKKWQYYFEERQWGSFYNLFETKKYKVKELIVDPGKSMSFQRHFKRNEIWLVSEGHVYVHIQKIP